MKDRRRTPSLRFVRAIGAALFLSSALAVPTRAAGPSASQPCQSTVTGDLRLHRLDSRIFSNSRTIRVLLPVGYDAPENARTRYAVLYLLDGQNLFDACLSEVSHHEWEVDETVYRLAREGKIPPMIVVGIDHAGRDRAYEFLPYRDYWADEEGEPREPAGKRFPIFLTGEVLPFVNARYRTLTGAEHTGIGGSSYGGVAALYAALAAPTQFGLLLIESPSLHVGMGQAVRDTSPLSVFPRKIYVGIGAAEGIEPRFTELLVRHVRQLEANLRATGYDNSNLRVVIEPGAVHTETAWARRLPEALTFLYGPDKHP